jgi:predicted DNA-binding protein
MGMIRLSDTTHDKVRKLSESSGKTITNIVARAVARYERDEFFRELKEQYAALTPEERAEDAAEIALWDNALADGLEDAPYEGSPANDAEGGK